MIALISPAKTMLSPSTSIVDKKLQSEPRFMVQTNFILSLMLNYDKSELQEIFKISAPLAAELQHRLISIYDINKGLITALESYDGVVYKQFKDGRDFSTANFKYLQKHLRISSLLYGLLLPLDRIKPYRMEGFVRLSGSDQRVDRYWRDYQTKVLIEDVKAAGGTLLYLASKEEQNAFHWKEVEKEIDVIDIRFLQNKDGKLKQVVIYTKMARGRMIAYMMDNNIKDAKKLKDFEWGGYIFDEATSTDKVWNFIKGGF